MSIARENGRLQVCCDSCPASYPNTYLAEDFSVMIADAKIAGWVIRKAVPAQDDGATSDLFGTRPRVIGRAAAEPYSHTCPDCANPIDTGGLF